MVDPHSSTTTRIETTGRRRRKRRPWVVVPLLLLLAVAPGYRLWDRTISGWISSAADLRRAGQPEQALRLLDRAIRLTLDSEDRRIAYGLRAACSADLVNPDQAVADISQAIDLANIRPIYQARDRRLRGIYLLQAQRPDEAAADFDAVISQLEAMDEIRQQRMQEIAASCHYHRGAVYHAEGAREKAQVHYDAAVALDAQWEGRPYAAAATIHGDDPVPPAQHTDDEQE